MRTDRRIGRHDEKNHRFSQFCEIAYKLDVGMRFLTQETVQWRILMNAATNAGFRQNLWKFLTIWPLKRDVAAGSQVTRAHKTTKPHLYNSTFHYMYRNRSEL